jgi:hypothetical protein
MERGLGEGGYYPGTHQACFRLMALNLKESSIGVRDSKNDLNDTKNGWIDSQNHLKESHIRQVIDVVQTFKPGNILILF